METKGATSTLSQNVPHVKLYKKIMFLFNVVECEYILGKKSLLIDLPIHPKHLRQ